MENLARLAVTHWAGVSFRRVRFRRKLKENQQLSHLLEKKKVKSTEKNYFEKKVLGHHEWITQLEGFKLPYNDVN